MHLVSRRQNEENVLVMAEFWPPGAGKEPVTSLSLTLPFQLSQKLEVWQWQ